MTDVEKNDNKHDRLAGFRRGNSSEMVNQGLWHVKTTVIQGQLKC